MSEALALEYGCPPPMVIYNAFPWSDRESLDGLEKDRPSRAVPSIHWYSQTLGPGRGLEDLVASLPHITHDVRIHLRGNPASGFDSWLTSLVPPRWQDRITFHGLVPEHELLSRISEHDIGFAGEMKYCASRQLTVTNKILHYLLGGLAVVASDTAGQREVAVQAPGAVFLYQGGDPASLAMQLNQLLASSERLRRAQAEALEAARQTFCWERVNQAFVSHIKRKLLSSADAARLPRDLVSPAGAE
jgi:glycosyltransferase involved in cell wall biosynthesis